MCDVSSRTKKNAPDLRVFTEEEYVRYFVFQAYKHDKKKKKILSYKFVLCCATVLCLALVRRNDFYKQPPILKYCHFMLRPKVNLRYEKKNVLIPSQRID